MIAKIIKLDEYLEKFRYNITRAVAHVMGLDPNDDVDIKKADQLIINAAEKKFNGNISEIQTNLVAALENKDDKAIKDLLAVEEDWTAETFNGVDIAEGYNYRNQITNEVAKNRIMDWLEESGLDYLIDLDGRFAVKCPNRKIEYKVGRAFERISNKWDNGPIKKAVDPDFRRSRLADVKITNALIDGLDEIAGAQPSQAPGSFKPIEPNTTPPLFPSKKKEKNQHLDWEDPALNLDEDHYSDNEEGVRQLMAKDFKPLTNNTEIIPDPSIAGVWLAIDHDVKQAWIVYLNDNDAEDVNYDEAIKKYSNLIEHVHEATKNKKKSPTKREKIAKDKLAKLPPVGAGGAEQIMKMFGQHGTDPTRIDKEKKEKEKKELRKKIKVQDINQEQDLNEHVLGMVGLPPLGRIKELAGLSDTNNTPAIENPIVNNDTIEIKIEGPKCIEADGLSLAMDKLKDTFEVYKMLDGDKKEIFRKNLIDYLMKDI